MKITAFLISVLFVAMLFIPVAAADTETAATTVPTPVPTTVPTTVSTTVSTPVPTTVATTVATTVPTPMPTAVPTTVSTTVSTPVPTTVPTTVTPTPVSTAVPTTKTPGPQVGWLTIISSPSGAKVTIDGKAAGTTPITGRELGSGSHTIVVTMTGYESYTVEKDLRSGEQAALDATLKQIPVTAVPTTVPTTPVTAEPTPVPTTQATAVPTPVPTTQVTAVPTTPAPVGSEKGWIRVNCNVNGAAVTFDTSSSGGVISAGFSDTEVVTTGTPYKTFTVRKSGYTTFTGPVTSWPANGKTVDLYATLNPNPTPSYGTIVVTSQPAGAIATIDGGVWQRTPATFSTVRAGTSHDVQITMSGYQSYHASVYVNAGQTTPVKAYLTPNPQQTGSLNINTVPTGADIYVDGHFLAESPFVVTNLAPGSHTVRLHKAGYDEYLRTVTVNAGKQTPITVTFTAQHSSLGSIEVSSTPGGSAVFLDGKYMGQTPMGSYFDLTSVTEGSHAIRVTHPDYQDFSQTVYVKGGSVMTLNAQLTPNAPSPTPDTTGQVVVSSTPSGAEVYLDDVFRGITPVTLSGIAAGSHTVTVKQTGYTESSQTVTVTGGQSTPVVVGLDAVPPTTKSPVTVVSVVAAFVILGAVIACGRRKE